MELSRPKSVALYLSLVFISLVILFGTIGLNSTSNSMRGTSSNSKLRVERNQNYLKRASKGFQPKISNKTATIVEPENDCAGHELFDTLEKTINDPVVNNNTDFITEKQKLNFLIRFSFHLSNMLPSNLQFLLLQKNCSATLKQMISSHFAVHLQPICIKFGIPKASTFCTMQHPKRILISSIFSSKTTR